MEILREWPKIFKQIWKLHVWSFKFCNTIQYITENFLTLTLWSQSDKNPIQHSFRLSRQYYNSLLKINCIKFNNWRLRQLLFHQNVTKLTLSCCLIAKRMFIHISGNDDFRQYDFFYNKSLIKWPTIFFFFSNFETSLYSYPYSYYI